MTCGKDLKEFNKVNNLRKPYESKDTFDKVSKFDLAKLKPICFFRKTQNEKSCLSRG